MTNKKPVTENEWAEYRFQSSLRMALKELDSMQLVQDSRDYSIAFALHSLCHALLELPEMIKKGKA